MTCMGFGGAEIIQLNPVEPHMHGTAFLNYPIVLEQYHITLSAVSIYCFNLLFCHKLSVLVSF